MLVQLETLEKGFHVQNLKTTAKGNSAFQKDEVMGPKLTILCETNKIHTKYTKQVYKTQDSSEWRTMMLERWEVNEVKPVTTPTYSLERVSRLQANRRNSGRAQLIPWAEGTKQREFREVKVARVCKTEQKRKESCTERKRESSRDPQNILFEYFSWVLTCQHKHIRKQPKPGKRMPSVDTVTSNPSGQFF